MFTQRTKMYIGILIAIIIIGVIGCNIFDRDRRNPTEPINPSDRLNFWAGGAVYHAIAVYLADDKGEFMVNLPEPLPEPKVHVIEYTAIRDGKETGPFYVMSRVKTGGAALFIGLVNEDTLWNATLYETEIPPGVTPIFENEHAALYYKPGEGNVTIAKTLEFPPPVGLTNLEVILWLLRDEEIVPGTARITPHGTLLIDVQD